MCVLAGTVLRESTAADLTVPLTIKEPAGVARVQEPACGGVPLPWGVYRRDTAFRVTLNGKDIPAQVIPLVVDEKGFLRWVLVDTQVDVPAGGNVELTLTTGKSGAAPATALKVQEDADGVSVDTGKASFTISKTKPFSLFSTVTAGGKTVVSGGSAVYVDVTDKDNPITCTAAAPTSVEVSEAGPMRVTIKVAGPFDGDADTKMTYVAWITAWAGQSRVAVKYSLANSNPDQFVPFRMIDESRVALKAPGAADAEGPGPVVTAGGLSAHDLLFEVKQPRKLEVRNGELLLRGITPMAEATGKTPSAGRSVILVDSSHASSRYVLDLAGGDLTARKDADRNILHVMAPLKSYFDTGNLAVGKFGIQEDEFTCYDTWKWQYDKSKAPQKPGYKMPVCRYVHGEDNHYESEEDIVEALVLMYLRTGARDFFTTAQAWADYSMDLQQFRTDGWRFKDGGVWWNRGGPSLGNRAQRAKDPVTGLRDSLPNPWYTGEKIGKCAVSKGDVTELDILSDSKQCYCHNHGAGLAAWFCLTGERDSLEAAVDSVEQNADTQRRAFGRAPGKTNTFSRDFTRSSYIANAVRLVVPHDEFVKENSDFLAAVYIKRPAPEPRGFVPPLEGAPDVKTIQGLTSGKGEERMKELGIELKDGKLHDAKTGKSWLVVNSPGSWMYTYLSGALECYYRLTGNEDAMDNAIAYGEAVARVLFQTKHSNLAYAGILVDFPTRGFAWDQASWAIPDGVENGEGVSINGYLARFHPDICARAYSLCGDQFLKQRAYDYWWGGSHRGYNSTKMHALGAVGTWVNITSDHDENVILTGRTFEEWSHPRADSTAPAAVTDLTVAPVADGKVTVRFTAPADAGGKVARYQVKCSERPLVEYEKFLELYNNFKDDTACNWFMASNVNGEQAPQDKGRKEEFTVTDVPAGAKFFAVRSFDDSSNRSPISNVAEVK
jgi:hypothetical protein